MQCFDDLVAVIVQGDSEAATELTAQFLAAGIPAAEILDFGLLPGIRRVGELFEEGEYFLPELLMGGEATTESLHLLEPLLGESNGVKRGRFLIGTVKDDIHDIGKNIIVMMLKGSGWQVTDLGVDVPAARFVEEVRSAQYDVLGLSSLLTMTMPAMVETIAALQEEGVRNLVKIMVGGAPVTPEWAEKIGADGYAPDAPSAIRVAAQLISRQGGS